MVHGVAGAAAADDRRVRHRSRAAAPGYGLPAWHRRCVLAPDDQERRGLHFVFRTRGVNYLDCRLGADSGWVGD